MIRTFNDLPGWQFEIQEVSAGAYEVIACDPDGRRRLSEQGTNPDALMQSAHAEALRLLAP